MTFLVPFPFFYLFCTIFLHIRKRKFLQHYSILLSLAYKLYHHKCLVCVVVNALKMELTAFVVFRVILKFEWTSFVCHCDGRLIRAHLKLGSLSLLIRG